jgi:hypothetical protein
MNEMRAKLAHHIPDAVRYSRIEPGLLAQEPDLKLFLRQLLLQSRAL